VIVPKVMIWRMLVLRFCIRLLNGTSVLLVIMDICARPISFSVVHSFAVSAVLARWLKMDAEETSVLCLDRYAEQLAFKSRGVRAC